MNITDFLNALYTGIVEFIYTKKNGDKRKAVGTLKTKPLKSVLSESKHNDDKPKRKRKFPTTSIFYYDCEKKAFRSFVAENLVSFRKV